MTTTVLVGVTISLAVIAIIIVKAYAGKPKKPEKWEIGQDCQTASRAI
jgi:hypothetical protein